MGENCGKREALHHEPSFMDRSVSRNVSQRSPFTQSSEKMREEFFEKFGRKGVTEFLIPKLDINGFAPNIHSSSENESLSHNQTVSRVGESRGPGGGSRQSDEASEDIVTVQDGNELTEKIIQENLIITERSHLNAQTCGLFKLNLYDLKTSQFQVSGVYQPCFNIDTE